MVQSLRKTLSDSLRVPAGYGCGPSDCTPPLRDPCQLRALPAVSCHSPAFRLRILPPAVLPDTAAGSSDCAPPLRDSCQLRALPDAPLFLLAVEGGRQGRERGTTVCFTRDRLRRAAAVGSVWRKCGMTGGRRLPGLQGGLVRMAGGDCRGCKVRLVAWRAAVAGSAK